MRNRELMMKKLEQIEGRMSLLSSMISKPNFTIDEFRQHLTFVMDNVSQIKSMIAREEFSPNEINKV